MTGCTGEPPIEQEPWDARTPIDASTADVRVLLCNGTPCVDDDPCTISECVDRRTCVHLAARTLCRCAPGCVSRASGSDAAAWAIDASTEGGTSLVVTDAGALTTVVEQEENDFLWVPNTNESTISRWDARSRRELARYRVGAASGECLGRCCWENGCNMPSRTVVDARGDAYIASRGFQMQGTVTKIAARRADCVDRNANGTIDTSTGPMDVLAFGEDECVLWTANVGPVNAVLRSLAIDRGDESTPNGYPWVGACANLTGLGNAGLFQLDPRTGVTIRRVALDRCAYGAIVTPDGTLWQHSYARGLTPVNPYSGTVGTFVAVPTTFGRTCSGATSYGVTADLNGRLWLSGLSCADALGYDPRVRAWTRVDLRALGVRSAGLGITVDNANRLWMPSSGSPPKLFAWSADAFVRNATVSADEITTIPLAVGDLSGFTPSAVGADRLGAIWVASYSTLSPLLRVDPATRSIERIDGPSRVYTYTDFTGGVRRLLLGSATHSEAIDTGCAAPQLAELVWDAETPTGTALSFSLRTAATLEALASATPVALAVVPPAISPADLTEALRLAGVAPARWVRVSVAFTPSSVPVGAPTLRTIELAWRCPTGPG